MNFSSILSTIGSILIAIVAFGIMITVHELGHFLVAKWCGIKVNKFAIGFGPRLLKWGKGETEYSIRLFPLGGFCAMEGEEEASDDKRAFSNKSVWKRMLVTVAGAFNNIVLGFLIFIIITIMSGIIVTTTIAGFDENALSHKTGLEVGDKIVSINNSAVYVDSDIVYELLRDKDFKFNITVIRDGKRVELKDVQFESETVKDYDYKVFKQDFWVESKPLTFSSVITRSAASTVSYGRIVIKSVVDLIRGRFKVSDMSGPVGVIDAISTASKQGLENLLFLVGFITINLGVFNLLPIPGLDGGRLIFLLAEAITRKRIPESKEAIINLIGIGLLLLLVVFITYFDISRIFHF